MYKTCLIGEFFWNLVYNIISVKICDDYKVPEFVDCCSEFILKCKYIVDWFISTIILIAI